MKVRNRFSWLSYVFAIMFLPFVSAYGSIFGYYRNPVDLLVNSDWLRFILVFGIFYALMFYSIKSVFKGDKNRGIAMVISICISLLVTIALAERGLLYGYFGSDLSSWLLFLVFLFIFVFIIHFSYKNFGPKFTAFALIFMWCVLAFYFKPEDIINSGAAADLASLLYYSWISVPGFIVTLLVALMLLFKKVRSALTHDLPHMAG